MKNEVNRASIGAKKTKIFNFKARWLLVPLVLLTLGVGNALGTTSVTGTYKLVTSTTGIAAGDTVLLVNKAGTYALTAISTTNTKYGIRQSVTSSNDIISLSNADVEELKVEAGNSSGSFSFKGTGDISNYLYWTSGNSLNQYATKNNKTSWTLDSYSAANGMTIKNVSDNTRIIRYNTTSGQERFACYTNSTGTLVNLYKKVYAVKYDKNGGTGTMTDASSPYNRGTNVTVLSNSFTAPSGKVFDKWNTKADGSGTSYAAGATISSIQTSITLYAQWKSSGTSVTLSKAATSNGSFTLSNNGPLNTATAQTITVTGTPNTGYYLSGVTQSGASSTPTITKTSATTYTIQYPASCTGTSTITATFSPKWQLEWGVKDAAWDSDDYQPMAVSGSAGSEIASASITLAEGTAYEFGLRDLSTNDFYKNTGAIITDISGWEFSTSAGNNCRLFSGPAGSYTVTLTLSNNNVAVSYPSVTHPAAGYAYFQKQDSWTGFKVYNYTSDSYRMSDWDGSPAVTNTTNICGTTYYYCAISSMFANVIFRDNSSNQWKAITTTGYSGKYCGDDYSASPQTWKTFGTYSLTFAGNGNTSGSMTDLAGQCPNSNIVLAANAFAKTGHTFTGWIANVNVKNSSGTTITAGTLITDESTIQITQNTILTAQWTHNPELTVSKSSIAFGDKKVSGSYTETFTVSGSYLKGNIGIAVSGTNSAMFTVSSSTLTPSDGSVATTTITVTYSPTTAASHSATITISSTGATSKTINLTGTGQYQDTYIDNIWNQSVAVQTGSYTRPSISDQDDNDQTDCQHLHYHFVGWITKDKYDAGTAIAAGDIQATGSVTASNATFYAVWAKKGSGGDVDDELNNANTINETTTTYKSWTVETSSTSSGAAYSGQSAGGNTSIQLRSNNSNSGIVTTTSGGKATKVVVTWNTNTADTRTISIYGKNSAYEAPTDLYDNSKQGTLLGDLNIDDATESVSELNITSDYEYIGIRSKSGALYLDDITITWSSVTYTDYIASCGAEYNITLDKNGGSTDGSAVVTANATALNSGFTAPVYAGHQVDYYMVDDADNSTKIAEADGTLASNVTVSGTPWTDANGKWVKGGDATFYAKWKATECVITLNNEGADSGHEGTASVTVTYGANTNLTTSINTPTKNGYDFGGYFTEAGGAGTQLINADGSWIASVTGYTNASKQWQLDATALELHAKWTLKSYTVTWVVNGETKATQTSVYYGTTYSTLTNEPAVADNALSDCGSDKFVGWVTQEYTAEGGTAAAQYDPYKVSASKLIDDNHHTFYAMFAKEEGTAFTLDGEVGSTQELQMSCIVEGTKYYATGSISSGKISTTTNSADANVYVFTKTGSGTYTIQLKGNAAYYKYDASTNLSTQNESYSWTISDVSSAGLGSWRLTSETADRGWICRTNLTPPKFGGYSTGNVSSSQPYRDVELGSSNLTNYRTGCCSEKITLAVSDATSGAGGTVALQWNNADKSAGDQVSTCSDGTLVAKVTANPGYILTAMAISGTNKSITITPSDLTTGLPSTEEMTYSVAVQALATGTLTITPTFSHTYTVTYDLADGETSGSTATVRYQSGETVTLVTPAPTKSGYNFTGWTVTKEGGGNVTVSGGKFTMPTDNVTATATWTEKTLTSISLGSASVEVYVGQYVEIPVTYDPADILTKGYTLVANPSYCVTTGSTNTKLKITGGRGGVTITENKTETVSIKADADDSKTASVSVTVKPLPVDHYVDLIHGVSFDDKGSTIVNNELSATYTAPGYGDYSGSTTGDCETNHLHLVGWIESEWADAHPKATHAEIIAAEGYNTAREAGMTASNKTYYAVWGDEQ